MISKKVHIIGKEEKTDGVLTVNWADTPATKRATDFIVRATCSDPRGNNNGKDAK
jgi:hypothetical protein